MRRRSSDRPVRVVASHVPDPQIEDWIASDRVQAHFQPQFDCRTGRLMGAEALARVPADMHGEDLFRRAHDAGLAERLSRQVQRRALRDAARWDPALGGLALSINLLPQDIGRAGFDGWLLREIADAGLDPRRITVEITENALIADQKAVAERLARLRGSGMRIGIDDFGTGYASLSYLSTLPLDLIKIDRGLVVDIAGRHRARVVVKAMIALAHELGLDVLVEGVEDAEQRDLIRDWGCDYCQGFIGSRPLDLEAFNAFVLAA